MPRGFTLASPPSRVSARSRAAASLARAGARPTKRRGRGCSTRSGRQGCTAGSIWPATSSAASATMTAVGAERLVDAMARAGFDAHRAPEARAPDGAVHAYVELHIEQGPRLDEAGVPIAVVDSIVGVRRTRLIFHGQADHAG